MIGQSIAHFEITAKIGEGGMGEVYQATDTKLNRRVALKILPESFAQDPQRMGRFSREAQVLASLNHPNILLSARSKPNNTRFSMSSIVHYLDQ